jgi:hypothetical protein
MTFQEKISSYLSDHYPGFSVKSKADSKFMSVLGWILGLVGIDFDQFTTTIGRTVYGENISGATLAHEGIHVIDDARQPLRFKLGYLFPQVLALGALGAFWFLPCLAFLLALLPWPAYWRVKAERRGYMMSSVCNTLVFGESYVRSPTYQAWLLTQFCGPNYFFMSWNKSHMGELLKADTERAILIARGEVSDPDYDWAVKAFSA